MKQEKDDNWVNAFMELCDEIKKVLLEHSEALCVWNNNGKADGFEEWYEDASSTDRLVDFSFMGQISGGASAGPAPARAAAPVKAAAAPGGKDFASELEKVCAPKIKAWRDAAAAINIPQVTKATEQYISCIAMQGVMLRTMAKFKKPANI